MNTELLSLTRYKETDTSGYQAGFLERKKLRLVAARAIDLRGGSYRAKQAPRFLQVAHDEQAVRIHYAHKMAKSVIRSNVNVIYEPVDLVGIGLVSSPHISASEITEADAQDPTVRCYDSTRNPQLNSLTLNEVGWVIKMAQTLQQGDYDNLTGGINPFGVPIFGADERT